MHDLTGDLAPRIADAGATAAFDRVLAALGYPDPTPDLPAWLAPFGEGYWVGLTPPTAVRDLALSFRPHRAAVAEAARQQGTAGRVEKVASFLEDAAGRGA